MKFHLPGFALRSEIVDHRKTMNYELKTHHSKVKQGFTLIELLVVIGILTVLLAIVLIAINPGKQFSQANNTQRRRR